MLTDLSKIRSNAMICAIVLVAVSLVCFSAAVFGHALGVVTLQIAVPLMYAALCMLCACFGAIMLVWVPAHDLIQRIRQSVSSSVAGCYFADDDFASRSLIGDTPPPRNTH